MDSNKAIGNKLRIARLLAGLTQEEVAAQAHCDRTNLSRKENGVVPLHASELAQFASIYNRPIAYFVESNDATGLFE